MTLLVDLDDPTVAQKFHFGGKRFRFRWLIGGRLIYVYNSETDPFAMLAIGIHHPDEPTYENAQVVAKLWIIERSGGFAENGAPKSARSISSGGSTRKRRNTEPPKPVVPPGYDGPLCCKCGKIDEGDFMQSPENMLEQICMTCLVKASK